MMISHFFVENSGRLGLSRLELDKIREWQPSRSARVHRNAGEERCEFCLCGNTARFGYALGSLSRSFENVIRVSYLVRAEGAGEMDIFRPESSVHAW